MDGCKCFLALTFLVLAIPLVAVFSFFRWRWRR
jgi:hypothetical protein